MKHDDIVAEIGRLSETTANLKKQLDQPKSRLDRFKEYAGVISLVLSVATGLFALYTTLVTEPQKSRAEDQTKLHETLAQIVSLDQEYLKQLQQGDPTANNGTLQSKRNILLQQAEDLADRKSVASFDDQINLGNSYEFGGVYDRAMSHFKAALKLAGNDLYKKALAETQVAMLDFYGISGGTKEDGRQQFDDAEKLLRQLNSSNMELALVRSLGVRSWVECYFGESEMGLAAKAKASSLLDTIARDPTMSPQLVDSLRVGLVTSLSNTRCAQLLSPPQLSPTGTPAPAVSKSKIDLSDQIMQLLVQRQYAALESRMNATVSSLVPLDRLREMWEAFGPQIGSYKRTNSTKAISIKNVPFYVVHSEFERAFVDLRLAFDETNQLSYFLITPRSKLPKEDIERMAATVASDFFTQKFSDVSARFDPSLAVQLPQSRLPEMWAQITNATGTFVRTTGATKNADLDIVDVGCEMQGAKVVVRVGYDLDMKINTFFIVPSK